MSEISDRHQEMFRVAADTGIDPEDQKPDHPRGSWGEMEEDYTDDAHHESWGKGIDEYADKYQPEDIKIVDR